MLKNNTMLLVLPAMLLTGSLTDAFAQSAATFSYTGSPQLYVVPSCVTSIHVDVQGAQGGGNTTTATGGLGGRVQATLSVNPGDTLHLYVGGQGSANMTGGYNGGGDGNTTTASMIGGGGGGASDIRMGGTTLNHRIIVAGGGGGATTNGGDSNGGAGGGLTGADGAIGSNPWSCTNFTFATGGTQSAGGLGGTSTSCLWNGNDGTFGMGGNSYNDYTSGGGGGGWYGGGGAHNGASGAGGSSYTSGAFTSVVHTQGYKQGDGEIIITPVVTPIPVVSLGNDTTLCGSGFTLDAGNTSSTFAWSTGATTQTITVTSSGTYYVTVSNATACSASDTITVVLHPLPVASIDNYPALCENEHGIALLSGQPAGGYYAGPGVINNGDFEPIIAGVGNHTIHYIYTDNNGCIDTASTNITVHPKPAVSWTSLPVACSNDAPFQLPAGTPAGGIYSGIATNAPGIFYPANAGPGIHDIFYTYTDSNSCSNDVIEQLTVHAAPTATIGSFADVCVDDGNFTLTGGLPAGGTYSGPGVISMTDSFYPSLAGTGTHTITYIYTDGNNCSDTATATIVVNACTGVTENSGVLTGLTISPNPSEGKIDLRLARVNNDLTVAVYDVTGRAIAQFSEAVAQGEFHKQYDLSSLAKGVYYIQVNSGSQSAMKRIVIQ